MNFRGQEFEAGAVQGYLSHDRYSAADSADWSVALECCSAILATVHHQESSHGYGIT